ncbi:MAG: hypothetical protein BGO34_14410 [Bacteroidia bacterium 44-10]|nr:MAG: hypothetical protein BGO34_14410 [Bacteroidia bacterium 44-10]
MVTGTCLFAIATLLLRLPVRGRKNGRRAPGRAKCTADPASATDTRQESGNRHRAAGLDIMVARVLAGDHGV